MTVQWLTGDVLDHVRSLPDASVDLVATSPPFLALRNYGDLDGQWGSEPTPAAFLDNLLTLTGELRRVLAPHGSIAIELGDTYSGSGGAGADYNADGFRIGQPKSNGSAARSRVDGNGKVFRGGERMPDKRGNGWPPAKSLCGIPTLFAWSLAYGRNLLGGIELEPWRVRNVIVWARNNPPVGALGDKVRPATSYITVACPSGKRWFDLDAVRDGEQTSARPEQPEPKSASGRSTGSSGFGADRTFHARGGAPPLDHWHDEYDGDMTWLINTAGSSLAHYAMWPASLAERLILSMCPAEVCRECGEPRRRIVETEPSPIPAALRSRSHRHLGSGAVGVRHDQTRQSKTPGWSDCGHGDYRPGHVLDPFCGTGTTLAVADIHCRDATGVDLDPDNRPLYERRYVEVWKALKPTAGPSPVTVGGRQLDLLSEATP